ncbi:MAG: YfhO family protein, partial [Anaerolineae bacterium]|nr:YfhO family protein [Anaerolineae bacterium]
LETNTPGYLVVADTFYPGWSAEVDGQETPILRANLAFRAIQLSAGSHQIMMRYAPGWFWPGLLISISGILVALVLLRSRNPVTMSEK